MVGILGYSVFNELLTRRTLSDCPYMNRAGCSNLPFRYRSIAMQAIGGKGVARGLQGTLCDMRRHGGRLGDGIPAGDCRESGTVLNLSPGVLTSPKLDCRDDDSCPGWLSMSVYVSSWLSVSVSAISMPTSRVLDCPLLAGPGSSSPLES